MSEEPLKGKLGAGGGVVEVDETYIGGKFSSNKRKRSRGRGTTQKIPVMTLIERGGDVRSIMVPNTGRSTMQTIVRPMVDETAHIMTDKHASYTGLDKFFASHDVVDHSKEYVRGI